MKSYCSLIVQLSFMFGWIFSITAEETNTIPAIAVSIEQIVSRINTNSPFPISVILSNQTVQTQIGTLAISIHDEERWNQPFKLKKGAVTALEAKANAEEFAFGNRSVRAPMHWSVQGEGIQEGFFGPVFAPRWNLNRPISLSVRRFHRLDARGEGSDLLGYIQWSQVENQLNCRLNMVMLETNFFWEILLISMPQEGLPGLPTRLSIFPPLKLKEWTVSILENGKENIWAHPEIQPANDRTATVKWILPNEISCLSVQVILWIGEKESAQAFCPLTSRLQNARLPAYAPELVLKSESEPWTHRVWVHEPE